MTTNMINSLYLYHILEKLPLFFMTCAFEIIVGKRVKRTASFMLRKVDSKGVAIIGKPKPKRP